MYKKGTGNDKQGKDAQNRTLCPYRNFSQAIKNCTDYVFLIDLASVNNFNISRYITPANILTNCDFLEAVMIIGIHPLFQFSEIIDAVLTYLTTEFINHFCHSSPRPILQVYSILYNSMSSRWESVSPTLGINFAVFHT